MKQRHLTPSFIRLYVQTYLQIKKQVTAPKAVTLSVADRNRLMQTSKEKQHEK